MTRESPRVKIPYPRCPYYPGCKTDDCDECWKNDPIANLGQTDCRLLEGHEDFHSPEQGSNPCSRTISL